MNPVSLLVMKTLGSFRCTGELLVSDPVFGKGVNLPSVASGVWNVKAYYAQSRMSLLVASFSGECVDEWKWTAVVGSIGVDSGTASIIDRGFYPTDERQHDQFCTMVTNIAFNDNRGGIISTSPSPLGAFGVVCESGWGDGFYSVGVHQDSDGVVNGVCIDFDVTEEEESESE